MSRSATICGPGTLEGEISVPGDKSISHRVAILASLADGTSTIEGYASGEDCLSTLACLRRLGVTIESTANRLKIQGSGLYGYKPLELPAQLHVGNSGSTIRMISGALAAQPFTSVLTGDSTICRRPMGRVIKPLELMGCRVTARDGGFPPLEIHGNRLRAIDYQSSIASAQVKSCVLIAGLFAEGVTSVTEPGDSRNHTELMLPEFGVSVLVDGRRIRVEGSARLKPVSYRVPGDSSSAAFFAAAAAMTPGSRLLVRSINLNPTRTGILEVLHLLGARVEVMNSRTEHREIVGDISITGGQLRSESTGTVIRGDIIPRIIDELPLVAVLATQTEGRVEVRDARELRVKESDRIRTIADGLRSFGGLVEEYEDGFAINGPQKLKGTEVLAAGDHRIAMALSIAAITAEGRTRISGAECVGVSFPEFFEILRSVSNGASIET
jgi:3-phosphoshikimate 1-carboxyvinyltransferase